MKRARTTIVNEVGRNGGINIYNAENAIKKQHLSRENQKVKSSQFLINDPNNELYKTLKNITNRLSILEDFVRELYLNKK